MDKNEKKIASELATEVASQIEDQLSSRLQALLQESIEVESICEIIEQLDMEERISSRFLELLRREHTFHHELLRIVPAMQKLLRELRLDVELTKRALASLGQTGVMARKQMEKQLTLELFPPEVAEPGAGIQVRHFKSPPRRESVDCKERLCLCKAACCRLFNAYLSAHEVRSNGYEWNTERPYALLRRNGRCVYLSDSYRCLVHDNRPLSCSTYNCKDDKRIWQDFDKRILNPKLKERLERESLPMDMDREEPKLAGTGAAFERKNEISGYSSIESTPEGEGESKTGAMHDLSPPDFSELKKRMAPRPRLVFNPKDSAPDDRGGDGKDSIR